MLVVAAAAAVGLVPGAHQTHTAAALQAGCTWPAAAVVAAVVAAGLRRTDHSLPKQSTISGWKMLCISRVHSYC